MTEFEFNKEDIDPSEFTEEELKEILFHGVFCAKVVEALAEEPEKEGRAAYNVIKHFDVPHDRTPSDIIQENALEKFEEEHFEEGDQEENSDDERGWNEVIREDLT